MLRIAERVLRGYSVQHNRGRADGPILVLYQWRGNLTKFPGASLVASLHPAISWFGGSAVVLALLLAMLPFQDGEPLVVQCAASQRGPVAEIAAAFEAESGHRVEVRYGASETILANMSVTGQGDVFLPADESYIEAARELGLVGESRLVARMTAVLIVPAGNRMNVRVWDDVFVKQLRLAQANPKATAIGRLTRERLQGDGRWQALHARTVVEKGNVNDVANDVALGAVDAGIVWDVMGRMNPRLTVIPLAELEVVKARVAIAIVRTSPRASLAEAFVRFLTDPERGGACFRRHGFDVVDAAHFPVRGVER